MFQQLHIPLAVGALGPERSAGALEAFQFGSFSHPWEDCPLARAYGEPGALTRYMARNGRRLYDGAELHPDPFLPFSAYSLAAQALKLKDWQVLVITRSFDLPLQPAYEWLRTALTTEARKWSTVPLEILDIDRSAELVPMLGS